MVAATLGLSAGIIDSGLYAASVLMALGTTMLTPILLAVWARRPSLSGVIEGTAASSHALSGSRGPLLQTVELD